MSTLRRRARAGSALGGLAALAAAAMLAAPALTGSAQAATTPKYTVKIINNAPTMQLFGINNKGDIFGTAFANGTQTEESFLLKAGFTTVQFLGTPGDQGNAQSSSVALGINASDNVVGYTLSSAMQDPRDVPIEWANSTTPTTLASLDYTLGARATGINDSGEIAGFKENFNAQGDKSFVGGGGNGDGFVYQNGAAIDLNTLVAPTAGLTLGAATGINAKGQIAGSATLNGQEVGYVRTPVS